MARDDLTDRERQVLEAVIHAYVESAEPAGSRTIARRFDLGVSAATIRNTMSDLEARGYLYHPHTSAGRIPTDLAYRVYVDRLMAPAAPTRLEQDQLRRELSSDRTAIERILGQASQVLGVLTQELGIAVQPSFDNTVNERLAGLSLKAIRSTLRERLRDAAQTAGESELLNIFVEEADVLFDVGTSGGELVLGSTQMLADQPEFSSNEQMRNLLDLTERRDVLRRALADRKAAGITVSIGAEHDDPKLTRFTLVTSSYQYGPFSGVIGVMGPTRMPYQKIVALVEHTSRLIGEFLE